MTDGNAPMARGYPASGHQGEYIDQLRALERALNPLNYRDDAQESPTKEDFAKWSRVWHDTCETMVTLLGLPGNGSPQELLAQVQAYVGTRPPAQRPKVPPCVHATCDDPEWCAGEPKCRYTDAQKAPDSSNLTNIAAECHRAKWQFDLSEDFQPSKSAARALILQAFHELHRIGDLAMKMRNAAVPSLSSAPSFTQCAQCWQPATCKKYGCRSPEVTSTEGK
jgi:hypothetical protein